MLQLLRDYNDHNLIHLTQEFFRDLNWVRIFLKNYNGVTIYNVKPLHEHMHIDASLLSLGGQFKNMVYSIPLPKDFMGYNITQLEMVNEIVALKVWGHLCSNKLIEIFCDNRSVVDVLSFGRALDQILATCARNVWLLSAMYNISIVVPHIQGTKNVVADLLSRWHNTADNYCKYNWWNLQYG